MKSIGIFDWSVKPLLAKEPSLLTQARIRFIYYALILAVCIVLVALPGLIINLNGIQIVRASIVLLSLLVVLRLLIRTGKYVLVSHLGIWICTLTVIVNAFVIFQSINIISIQLIMLAVTFAFFILGQRWGLIYSVINVVPIVVFIILDRYKVLRLPIEPEYVNSFELVFNIVVMFMMLIYILWHFNKAYQNTLESLEKSSKEQHKLNQRLEEAIFLAEKSSQAKSSFLSTMSHEIRTPLNVVIGMSNILMDESPRPEQKENIQLLKHSAESLLLLISDLLDFTKLESGKAELEKTPFDIYQLLGNLNAVYSKQCKYKGLEFHYAMSPPFHGKVIGDSTRLNQILNNLLNNAVKFTEKGSVSLTINPTIESKTWINFHFSVKDTGIGIPEDKLEEIFDPFTQTSAYINRKYGGTGLGLAIVRKLLKIQNSEISVKSQENKGTEFTFDIGYNYIFAVEEKSEVAIGASEKVLDNSIRILLAEDTMLNVLVLNKFLSKWKIGLAVAGDGQTAIRMHLEDDFDLILMDLQMPGMNGYQATRAIRALKDIKKSSIPIIALTASDPSEVQDKVLAAGMNDLITKPFDPTDILNKIKHYSNKSTPNH